MKILICGKGGVGKSTIVALLTKELARREKKVLVLDSDESNFSLNRLLGMEKPRDFMDYFGGKKVLMERAREIENELTADQLPRGYLTEKGNIRLLAVGKIYDFGEGCACPINVLSAKLLEKLQMGKDEVLIADTDAGVEHLGRGIEKGCDSIFVVVEPSRESIELAKRVIGMMENLEKGVYYILNKTDIKTEKILRNALSQERIIAVVPDDERIFMCGLEGNELLAKPEGIDEIADFLEAEMRIDQPDKSN